MDTTQIFFRRTRDFGQILNDTFAFVRLNFRRLLKCLVFIAGPAVLITAILAGIYMSNVFSLMSRKEPGSEPSFGEMGGFGITVIAISAFSLIALTLLSSVVYNYIILYMDRGPDSFDVPDVWTEVKRTFFTVFSTWLGQWLLLMLLGAILVVPGIATQSPVLVVIGAMAYFCIVLYTIAPLLLMPIIRIREEIGFSDALSRSFELVKENWWRTIGLVVIMAFISNIISMVFYIPQYIMIMVSAFHSIERGDSNPFTAFTGPMRILMIAFTALPYLAAYLAYSLPIITLAFQYFNLVERKDGTGLLERIEEFGTPVNDDTLG
jgi:hypothetical protein